MFSAVCNVLFMYCCSMPPKRYSAMADRDRPASTRELTFVDLAIHVAMVTAIQILEGHDRYGTCWGVICQASLAWIRLECHCYQASLQGHRWNCQGQGQLPSLARLSLPLLCL